MTAKQVELLIRCIHAVRFAQAEELDPTTQGGGRHHDYELVEVAGKFNSVDKRTADSLVKLGLLVEDMPYHSTEYTNTHVRLPRYGEIPGYGDANGKPLIEVLADAE